MTSHMVCTCSGQLFAEWSQQCAQNGLLEHKGVPTPGNTAELQQVLLVHIDFKKCKFLIYLV